MNKNIFEFNGKLPEISDKAVIYDTAEITGDVKIGEGSGNSFRCKNHWQQRMVPSSSVKM